MVRDARVHEARGNMDGKPESGEPASAFEPTGDVIGQRNFFPRDPEYHFARLDDNRIAILDADARGDVLEPGVVRDMVDLGPLLEYPEFVPERQIDGAGPTCDLSSGSILIVPSSNAFSISTPIKMPIKKLQHVLPNCKIDH